MKCIQCKKEIHFYCRDCFSKYQISKEQSVTLSLLEQVLGKTDDRDKLEELLDIVKIEMEYIKQEKDKINLIQYNLDLLKTSIESELT